MPAEGIPTPTYEDLVDDVVTLDVDGMPIRALALPKLTELERLVGRPKDAAHILEIEALLRRSRL